MKAQRSKNNRKDKETGEDFQPAFKEKVKFDGKMRRKSEKSKLFQDIKKWDMELEKLDREEVSLKKSLKEISNRIYEIIHKKVSKSVSDVVLKENKDKSRIEMSNDRINKAVNRNKSEKKRIL